MSNPTRIAEREPTDTSSPMPVDVARDLLAVVRALEARVAVLESLLASAIKPRHWIDWSLPVDPSDALSAALSAALRLPTVPDAYGR